jgi:pimeloyl-ACP methyl ester carboxylesterase
MSNKPLHTLFEPAGDARAETLLVLLPGAYDQPEDFRRHGFGQAVRRRGLALDLLFAETDLTGVADGSLVARLHAEVVQPARRDWRRVLVGGISIGGLTALIHADEHPEACDGLVLLAPYPGNRMVSGEIAAAGGLAAWHPDAIPRGDGERRAWRTLARLSRLSRQADPPLWLGFGAADRFAPAHRMMAAVLPARRVCELPGGHDWGAWSALWERFLESGFAG